jgi:hypothetical protein
MKNFCVRVIGFARTGTYLDTLECERTSPGGQGPIGQDINLIPAYPSLWSHEPGTRNRRGSELVESTRCAITWPAMLCRYAQALQFGNHGRNRIKRGVGK